MKHGDMRGKPRQGADGATVLWGGGGDYNAPSPGSVSQTMRCRAHQRKAIPLVVQVETEELKVSIPVSTSPMQGACARLAARAHAVLGSLKAAMQQQSLLQSELDCMNDLVCVGRCHWCLLLYVHEPPRPRGFGSVSNPEMC